MVGFKLINSDIRALTPDLAVRFKDMAASPTERDLDQKHVKYLREKIDNGLAVPFHWATARLGEVTYRMNGQHSSVVLSEMNGSFPEDLKVHWDEYTVDDLDSLAVLFRQFDDRKSSRTTGDVSGAYQGLYADLNAVNRGNAKLTLEGIAWWRINIEGLPTPKGDDVYTLYNQDDYRDFIKWADGVLSIKTPEMKRQPIIAAIFATHNANPPEAEVFWAQVARGGIETDDAHPSTVLDVWLRKIKEDASLRDRLKPGSFYQGCIFAWNAWREDKSVKDIKYDTRKGFHAVTA